MKKFIVLILITVVVLGGLFFIAGRRKAAGAVTVKTATAKTGEIKSYLSTTAVVKSRASKEYYGLQAKVSRVNVKVGDRVKKGDVLLTYETQDFSTAEKQARIQYNNAVLQRNDIYNQNMEIKNKISDLDREISKLERSLNPLDLSKLEALRQQRRVLSPISQERLKQADNAVALARLALDSARDRLAQNKNTIEAEHPGVVTDITAVEGAISSAMQPAVTVKDTESLKAVAALGRSDANRVAQGQSVIVKSGDKSYKGKVSFIDPAAKTTMSPTGSTASLGVEIDIMDKSPGLKIDFDVDVDILVGQSLKVIKVPAECVKFEKGNRALVYVLADGTVQERPVTIGIQSDMEIEIKEGVKEGEKVILNPSTSIKSGVKVRESGGK